MKEILFQLYLIAYFQRAEQVSLFYFNIKIAVMKACLLLLMYSRCQSSGVCEPIFICVSNLI